jgi:hypothetical protein
MVDDFAALPPATGSTPSEPVHPGSGSNSMPPPGPVEKPVKIITLPLDERTRQFLAELRDVVRAAGRDSEHVVSEFMAHSVTPAVSMAPSLKLLGTPVEALRGDVAALARLAEANVSTGSHNGTAKPDITVSAGTDHATPIAGNSGVFSHLFQSPAISKFGTLNADATWPLAMSALHALDHAAPVLAVAKEIDREDSKLADSVRAFGNYIVDRFAAEFSPGDQSLILLVDPKPAPTGSSNPASAIEAFARGTRKIVANLRNVHG